MYSKVLFLFVCVISLFSSCRGGGKEYLFNGKDLSGWVLYADPRSDVPADQVFTVQSGVIKVSGEPFGYMRTEKTFENFKLHVEWRWVGKKTDSGIYVHLQEGDKIWPRGIQYQMKEGQLGNLIGGMKMSGGNDMGGYFVKPVLDASDAEKPLGEWNVTEIVCNGVHYSVTLNGTLQNETDCETGKGYIALQSEGGPIEFRNVYIVQP